MGQPFIVGGKFVILIQVTMSKELREALDNFDTDTLGSLEYSRYLLLLEENNSRLALLKLALNYEPNSIGLMSLKWAIEQQEKNITEYE